MYFNIKTILIFILLSSNSLIFSQYFEGNSNLKCGCSCNENFMDKTFLKELKRLEEKCNFNFYITSGYRCRTYNKHVGGHEKSSHLEGLAADIRWSGNQKELNQIINFAKESNYFTRVIDEGNHIHIAKRGNTALTFTKLRKKTEYNNYSSDRYGNFYGGLTYNNENNQLIRLGYHFPTDPDFSGINIYADKLIKNKEYLNIKSQFSIGFNWHTWIGLGFEYYGLGLSLGSLSNNTNKSYYIEPALSMGFIFDYCDVWLNIGNIIPNKSSFNEIKGTNISLNINIGYFNFNN